MLQTYDLDDAEHLRGGDRVRDPDGQVTEECVLYSARDAHIRHIPVVVARDAVAHIHADLAVAALQMMELNMNAELRAAHEAALSYASRSSAATASW